jgi:hypothetical protein
MIYVQSSWWCWWFGGGYGLRPYISMYPLLAFPMAMLLKKASAIKPKAYYYALSTVIVLMVAYSIFQTRQYTTNAVHYSGTTLRSYIENFMKTYPTGPSWKMLSLPDFELARKGIHVSYPTSEDKASWSAMDPEEARDMIRKSLSDNKKNLRQIRRYSKRENIPQETAMEEVVERMYEEKTE